MPDKLLANISPRNVPPFALETKSVAGVTFSPISCITSRSVGLAPLAIASTLAKLCLAIVPILGANISPRNVPPFAALTKSVRVTGNKSSTNVPVTVSPISWITSRSVGPAPLAIAITLDRLCVAIVPSPAFKIFLVAGEYVAEAEPEAIAKTLDKLCVAIVPNPNDNLAVDGV